MWHQALWSFTQRFHSAPNRPNTNQNQVQLQKQLQNAGSSTECGPKQQQPALNTWRVLILKPKAAGHLMRQINLNSLSKSQLKTIKSSIQEAVTDIFPGGHAQVQLQGSVAKGSATRSSDLDFYIKMDNTIASATDEQRQEILDRILAKLKRLHIHYQHSELRGNLIKLKDGKVMEAEQANERPDWLAWTMMLMNRDARQEGAGQETGQETSTSQLPDVDIVFRRSQAGQDERLQPDSTALADSHVLQQVVKYIKGMPEDHYGSRSGSQPGSKPNVMSVLASPISSYNVERYVKNVLQELQRSGYKKKQLTGADGLCLLLGVSLGKMANRIELLSSQEQLLKTAGIRGDDWVEAASTALCNLEANSVLTVTTVTPISSLHHNEP